jgi:hypothetical protein
MAKFTAELRDIVESGVKIFNFEYPFYDETKRTEFEQRFIDHFYFREIGVETTGKFIHYLKCKCNERLPYYNELLNICNMDYEVLKPYNINETYAKTNTNNRSGTSETIQSGTMSGNSNTTEVIDKDATNTITEDKTTTINDLNKNVSSDTPNGLLSMTDIKNNVYASNAEIVDNENTSIIDGTQKTTIKDDETNKTNTENSEHASSNVNSSQNETNTENETYNLTRKGHIGVQTASELLEKHIELQQKIRTFYTQFFNECEDLFMCIY